jgi:hypothetical protein
VLREPQMVGIRRLATADQAWLLGYVSDVISVTDPAWLREGEGAFVDRPRDPLSPRPLARSWSRCAGKEFGWWLGHRGLTGCPALVFGVGGEAYNVRLERFLDPPGMCCGQSVLFWERPVCPTGGVLARTYTAQFREEPIAHFG